MNQIDFGFRKSNNFYETMGRILKRHLKGTGRQMHDKGRYLNAIAFMLDISYAANKCTGTFFVSYKKLKEHMVSNNNDATNRLLGTIVQGHRLSAAQHHKKDITMKEVDEIKAAECPVFIMARRGDRDKGRANEYMVNPEWVETILRLRIENTVPMAPEPVVAPESTTEESCYTPWQWALLHPPQIVYRGPVQSMDLGPLKPRSSVDEAKLEKFVKNIMRGPLRDMQNVT